MKGYERIQAMFQGEPVDQLALMPITMMFAADQLGVPYRQYVTDYRALTDAQMLTAERFGFDHVSVISDPAREAADCGATVQFFDNQPPALDEENSLLADKTRLVSLTIPDPLGGSRMRDRVAGVARFRERVGGSLAIEGWIEGPCAEAADLRGIHRLMLDFFDDAVFVQDLFEFTLEMGLRFARAQVQAGVDLVGVGDSVTSLVGPEIYDKFIKPYHRRLVDGLHTLGTRVRLHICGNITHLLPALATLGCDIVDLDAMVSMAKARQVMGPSQVLAGNVDPVKVLCNGTPEMIVAAGDRCRQEAMPRYVVAAGCEVPRQTPIANLHALASVARA